MIFWNRTIATACALLCATTAAAKANEQDIEFYNGNNCRGGVAFTMNSNFSKNGSCKGNRPICKNDTARSVFIRQDVKLPLSIVLHDDPDGAFRNDDVTSIKIWAKGQSMRTSGGYCVGTFERTVGRTWMSMNWNRGNGIDGKVSYIRMGRN